MTNTLQAWERRDSILRNLRESLARSNRGHKIGGGYWGYWGLLRGSRQADTTEG
jgi:hypothetical protein